MKAVVRNGRIAVDEPTELADGTELELVVDDGGDDLDEDERAALHEALDRSFASAKAGRTRPAQAILDEITPKK